MTHSHVLGRRGESSLGQRKVRSGALSKKAPRPPQGQSACQTGQESSGVYSVETPVASPAVSALTRLIHVDTRTANAISAIPMSINTTPKPMVR